MLIVPAVGSLFLLGTFYLHIHSTKNDVVFTNIAGRQRMLSEQLGVYTHKVQELGLKEDRESLQDLVAIFDYSIGVLDQGGEIMDHSLAPPPQELQIHLSAVKQLWQSLKPSLLMVAEQPVDNQQTVQVINFIQTTIPHLRDLSDEVVFNFEMLSNVKKDRILWILIVVLGLNFVLLLNGIIVILRYIADRKKVEKVLRESESKFRTIFEVARDAIYMVSKKGDFLELNDAAAVLFGYSREEMMRMNTKELYVNQKDHFAFQGEIRKKGFVRDYELKIRKRDGIVKDCLYTASVIKDPEGQVIGYQGIIRDKKKSD